MRNSQPRLAFRSRTSKKFVEVAMSNVGRFGVVTCVLLYGAIGFVGIILFASEPGATTSTDGYGIADQAFSGRWMSVKIGTRSYSTRLWLFKQTTHFAVVLLFLILGSREGLTE
jgi:hypothetical protein